MGLGVGVVDVVVVFTLLLPTLLPRFLPRAAAEADGGVIVLTPAGTAPTGAFVAAAASSRALTLL